MLIQFLAFFANLGLRIKSLGIEPSPFGTFIITSVGAFNIEDAYAPLIDFSYTMGVVTINSIVKEKILMKNGDYQENEVMNINFSIDHRYMDGAVGAKLIREMKIIFEDPFSRIEL